MLEYIEHVIVPYVEKVCEEVSDKLAPAIVDNFKEQVTDSVSSLLELHNIHVYYLPPNTTDHLQPVDIAVNKPAKEFLQQKFVQWYSKKVIMQLEGRDMNDLATAKVLPINLSMSSIKRSWSEVAS